MALEQKLNLRMSQKLIMTPSLQQAIKLLQMTKLELQEEITQEVTENPLLEEMTEGPAEGEKAEGEEAAPGEAGEAAEGEAPATPRPPRRRRAIPSTRSTTSLIFRTTWR